MSKKKINSTTVILVQYSLIESDIILLKFLPTGLTKSRNFLCSKIINSFALNPIVSAMQDLHVLNTSLIVV